MFDASGSEHGKGHDEDANLGSAIQGSGHDIVVLHVPIGIVSADVILREQGDAEEGENGRVDTNAKVSEEPAENGRVDVVPLDLWVESAQEILG